MMPVDMAILYVALVGVVGYAGFSVCNKLDSIDEESL